MTDEVPIGCQGQSKKLAKEIRSYNEIHLRAKNGHGHGAPDMTITLEKLLLELNVLIPFYIWVATYRNGPR